MRKFFVPIVSLCGIALLALSVFLLRDNPFHEPGFDFNQVFDNRLVYVVFYFTGFTGLYLLFRKKVFTKTGVIFFLAVFLLTCPVIISSETVLNGSDSYNGQWLNEKTTTNTGTGYNKISIFATGLVRLFTIKTAYRSNDIYFERDDFSVKRFSAIGHSNLYQIHFFSIVITFLIFAILYMSLCRNIRPEK